MLREAHGFGETVPEAQEAARLELGAGLDDEVQFEIVSQPKKKVLGVFGGSKAEVRAFIELPDEKPKKEKKTVKSEKTQNVKKEKKPAEKKAEKMAVSTVREDYANAVDASEIDANTPCGKAISYLTFILKNLGCENITAKAALKENGAYILIDGDGIGAVIGHRGETLDALQYLTSLAANNGNGYFKVSLNIGNYREKREQTLSDLANKVCAQVLKTGKSRRLEPMNPYERRIIHTAVQAVEGVTSSSVGEGANRRVVILPEGAKMPDFRDDRNRHGRRDNSRRRPSNTVASTPTREPKKDSDTPLYGKIN